MDNPIYFIDRIQDMIISAGLENPTAAIAIARTAAFIIMLIIAYITNLITRKLLISWVHKIVIKTKSKWDDVLLERKFFYRLCHLGPAAVIYCLSTVVFAGYQTGIKVTQNAAAVYLVLIGAMTVDAFLNAVVDIYRTFESSRKLPIRGSIQVVKIVVYAIAVIVVLSEVLDKPPFFFLGSIGAMTAVLILVFKDSILGFIAGIQLISNNMVHIGDWIEMPKYGADGDVIDISLMTVKVQNWDKTIVTIPAYALVSDSFKNWRGMKDSGGRRIKRSLHIDMNSIRFCTEDMLNKFRKFQHITEYIDSKKKEIAEHNAQADVDDSELINGRRLTNVGVFRAYVAAYLRNHPQVHNDMTFLVRHLEPTPKGLPIQIYVFCTDQVWANYENIQADIFDHILAVVPEFELRVFQEPSGADFNSTFLIENTMKQ